MKRTLVGVGSVFVLAGLAVAGWLIVVIQQIQAQTDSAVARIADQREVAVTFIVDPPETTPNNQPLYLSGSSPRLGNWDASGVRLEKADDGTYRRTLKLLADMTYGYKVTRGTWSTVERGPDDTDMPNRELRPEEDQTVRIKVATWVDRGQSIPGRITLTGDIRMHKLFPSDILGNERTLIVFVPAGYDEPANAAKQYPVLYMNDGQNLMDASTSFNGLEWRVDETITRLIEAGQLQPTIVVGIYNTPDREAEFTPGSGEAARGDAYANFVAEEVKPFIDETYRTRPTSEATGIGGGGHGAVIAVHTARQHPSVFGKLLAFDPWQWGGQRDMLAELGEADELMAGVRAVTDESDLAAMLRDAGVADAALRVIDAAPEANREPDWADRFGDAVRFLYGGE